MHAFKKGWETKASEVGEGEEEEEVPLLSISGCILLQMLVFPNAPVRAKHVFIGPPKYPI